MVKTAPSHGAISGSNPLGVTSIQEHQRGALFLCVQIGKDRKLKRKQISSKCLRFSLLCPKVNISVNFSGKNVYGNLYMRFESFCL